MIVGIPRETFPGETRVALVPSVLPLLAKLKMEVLLEPGAGVPSGYPDAAYEEKDARLAADREALFRKSDVVVQVRGGGSNPEHGRADLERLRRDQVVIGFLDPLAAPEGCMALANRGVTAFSMEMMPRISRAQNMDALSSMATVAGYAAVLMAAVRLPKMFPLMMTAAGTISPARVLVIGAGVAGLQAIATARRLGAVVHAYDVRPAVKEQVESLGAQFLELDLQTQDAEDKGGYAREQGAEFYRRQQELLGRELATRDVVITTAAVPGKKAPVLVTQEMVEAMAPGSVIVDLAAERGGNCEATRPDEEVDAGGVVVLGPTNLAAAAPYHASQMYARNITNFLRHLVKDGTMRIDTEDEITRETMVVRGGQVVHPRLQEILGMAAAGSGEKERR